MFTGYSYIFLRIVVISNLFTIGFFVKPSRVVQFINGMLNVKKRIYIYVLFTSVFRCVYDHVLS